MDFLTSRRAATTYGKGSRKPLVHDLFDYRSARNVPQEQESEHAQSFVPVEDTTGFESEAKDFNSRSSQFAARPPAALVPKNAPSALQPPSQPTAARAGTFSFDISSSDEEKQKQTKVTGQTNKRRKLVQPIRASQQDIPGSANSSKHSPQKPTSIRSKTLNAVNNEVPVIHPHGKRPPKKHVQEALKAESTRSDVLPNKQKAAKSKPALRMKTTSKLRQRRDGGSSPTEENVSTDTSGNLTDRSVQSNTSTDTPKRKRPPSRPEATTIPSPTALGLTSLKLTPEKRLIPRTASSAETSGDDGHGDHDRTPRRTRSRLIDRLDAPNSNPVSDAEGLSHIRHEAEEKTERSKRPRTIVPKKPQPDGEDPTVPRLTTSGSSQGRVTYSSRTRTTYGKERSYLNDMVDNLDVQEPSSGQHVSQSSLLKMTTSDLATQMDLEDDDSDEQTGLGRLKSIHELRQAGTNNRFDREFQTILEDVETSAASLRSLRLAALMKLAHRLEDTVFLRHIVTTGNVGRLAGCASYASDPISAVLLVLCLSALCSADASSETMLQLFGAGLRLSSGLLTFDSPLSVWAQERKQNLSKSMIREVTEFESHMQTRPLLPDFPCATLCPSSIALYCLDTSVRGLLRLGTGAQVLASVLALVVDLLQRRAITFRNGSHTLDEIRSCQMALQFFEACSIASGDVDLALSNKQYRILGGSFVDVMSFTKNEDESLDHNVLRVLVSLSNNKPQICRSLAQTSVLSSVLSIIDVHFLLIAAQAEREEELQHQRLDSVILALGCLLNFAECDDEARYILSTTEVQGRDCVTVLVAIFNSQVGKYQEAETEDQTQVMVAFGYMSMLLCALSLDPSIRLQITGLLKGKSFDDVCAAGETFFSHLRTLDAMSNEGGGESMSAFTQRFSAILETLKTLMQ